MIKTIFWDVGGVLLTNGWDKSQRTRVLSRLGVDLDRYEALHEAANQTWERGLSTAEDFFQTTVFDPNPNLDLTFDQLWPQVCAESKVLHPDVLDIICELKESATFTLATLNNESRELNEHRLDAFHLRPLFHYFLCSGFLHEMKPHPRFFQDAIDISGRPASTALFIDDKPENCQAAKSSGMNTIRFQTPAQLRAQLADYGVKLSS